MISLIGGTKKNAQYIAAERGMVVTKGGEVWEMGKCWSKSTKLDLRRRNASRHLTCSTVTIAWSTILNFGNLLGVDFRCSRHTHTHTQDGVNSYVKGRYVT